MRKIHFDLSMGEIFSMTTIAMFLFIFVYSLLVIEKPLSQLGDIFVGSFIVGFFTGVAIVLLGYVLKALIHTARGLIWLIKRGFRLNVI